MTVAIEIIHWHGKLKGKLTEKKTLARKAGGELKTAVGIWLNL